MHTSAVQSLRMSVRWSASSTSSFLSGVLGEVKGEQVEVPELGWVFDLLLQCVTPPLQLLH